MTQLRFELSEKDPFSSQPRQAFWISMILFGVASTELDVAKRRSAYEELCIK